MVFAELEAILELSQNQMLRRYGSANGISNARMSDRLILN